VGGQDGRAKLTDMQLDALKEVSNRRWQRSNIFIYFIRKIDRTVPSVNMIEFATLIESGGEEEVAGIVVRVLGDFPGSILIIFEKDIAKNIIEMLTGVREEEFSELGNSVLCEIGNILSGSYMNAIAQFTGLRVVASVPAVAVDMLCNFSNNICRIWAI
jgi:chemotaxis protein CheC